MKKRIAGAKRLLDARERQEGKGVGQAAQWLQHANDPRPRAAGHPERSDHPQTQTIRADLEGGDQRSGQAWTGKQRQSPGGSGHLQIRGDTSQLLAHLFFQPLAQREKQQRAGHRDNQA